VSRPVQRIRIFNLQDRTSNPAARSPYIVRWRVDGQDYSEAFPTRPQADRYRARLLVARADGEHFDPRSGEPVSWSPAGEDTPVHAWARRWTAEQWDEWAPRTRKAYCYSLARFLPLVCAPGAPPPPKGLRKYLRDTLPPDADIDERDPCERWLDRWCLSLGDLTRENLAEVSRKLGVGDRGQTLASASASRYRRESHSCIRRAVDLEFLPVDPWPPTPKGRNRRKVHRARKTVDIRRLPDPAAMVSIIDHMRSHQPGSRTYQAMTAVVYYGGLRPSEVAMLRPRALILPDDPGPESNAGWGYVEVTEADDGWDEPVEPKTGDRRVPIPPRLVRLLRDWVREHHLGPDDLLFRTRCGNRPSESNWARAMKRACELAKHRRIRVYDGRHAAATTWLKAGLPLGDTARRLGHSVETLVSHYIGALDGDETSGNKLIDAVLSATREQIVEAS